MQGYLLRRIMQMIPTLFIISILIFILIQLPPGDIISSKIEELQQQGQQVSSEQIEALRAQYNLDDPMPVQYFRWLFGMLHGDFGYSMIYDQPVNTLIWDRIGLTAMIAILSLMFTWVVALPIGIVSAVRQYTLADYFFTLIGLIGISMPNFLLALVLMFLGYEWFGVSVGGLFSPQYMDAPWSIAKCVDLLKHIWIPMVVIGTAGTAGLMRVMRANLLDELRKPYVVTALAKGVKPLKLIIKYPVRLAINPLISTLGFILPRLISGAAIVSVVLNLPTTGPLLLESLMGQDMYLAGSLIMMISVLTVIGILLSDIALAIVDPRIRYE